MTEKKETFCPMLARQCMKGKCAWYMTANLTEGATRSTCAIPLLASSQTLALFCKYGHLIYPTDEGTDDE